jgi:hypothetical protein
MGAEKKLQRLMDRVARKGGNSITIDGANREELQEKLIDNKASSSQWKRAKKLADKVMPSYQGVKPVKNMSDEQARSIDEDEYSSMSRKSALNMLGVSSPLNCWTKAGYIRKPGTKKGAKGSCYKPGKK